MPKRTPKALIRDYVAYLAIILVLFSVISIPLFLGKNRSQSLAFVKLFISGVTAIGFALGPSWARYREPLFWRVFLLLVCIHLGLAWFIEHRGIDLRGLSFTIALFVEVSAFQRIAASLLRDHTTTQPGNLD